MQVRQLILSCVSVWFRAPYPIGLTYIRRPIAGRGSLGPSNAISAVCLVDISRLRVWVGRLPSVSRRLSSAMTHMGSSISLQQYAITLSGCLLGGSGASWTSPHPQSLGADSSTRPPAHHATFITKWCKGYAPICERECTAMLSVQGKLL